MKQLSFIVGILCLTLTACQKSDEGVETLGTYNEQLSGFEGTVTYAKDGKPAVEHPVTLQVGIVNSTTFDPLTGIYTPVLDKNNYYKTLFTDNKGQYSIIEKNANFPIRSGFLFANPYTASREFEYYFHEYIVNGVSQKGKTMYDTQLNLGKIKKVDVKLHEAYHLKLTLLAANSVVGDVVKTTGKWYSPVNGKEFILSQELYTPAQSTDPNAWINVGVFALIKSKPNTPITLTIEHFYNKVLKSTRTITVPMTQKETNIELL